jgi:hypothetical protein
MRSALPLRPSGLELPPRQSMPPLATFWSSAAWGRRSGMEPVTGSAWTFMKTHE